MEDAHAQAHAPIAAREGPGIAARRELAAHNQVQFVLRIMWRVQVVFRAIAIAMKRLAHVGAYPDVTREATRIDGNGRAYGDSLADMIPGVHAQDAPIFQ